MRYKFFTNSENTWKAMFEAIAEAKESVYMEMYMFSDDMEKYDFVKLLKEKAQSGVRVRIILDVLGSRNFSLQTADSLKESGAELFFIKNIVHRTHRKILIVDEAAAFIGGVNFSRAARKWNDLVVEVKGKLAEYIVRSFAKVYVECGGKDPKIVSQNKRIVLDKTRTWLIEHFPNRQKFSFKRIYQENINEAQTSVIIITPYFIPKRWMIKALRRAVSRGVKAEVLVPEKTDHYLSDRVNHFYMYKLSKLGVLFHVEHEMNHSKAMIMDNKKAVVGSQNVDFFSFDLNYEIGVFFEDAEAVGQLLEITEKWKSGAYLFDHKNYKPKWFDYIISPAMSVFARIF